MSDEKCTTPCQVTSRKHFNGSTMTNHWKHKLIIETHISQVQIHNQYAEADLSLPEQWAKENCAIGTWNFPLLWESLRPHHTHCLQCNQHRASYSNNHHSWQYEAIPWLLCHWKWCSNCRQSKWCKVSSQQCSIFPYQLEPRPPIMEQFYTLPKLSNQWCLPWLR